MTLLDTVRLNQLSVSMSAAPCIIGASLENNVTFFSDPGQQVFFLSRPVTDSDVISGIRLSKAGIFLIIPVKATLTLDATEVFVIESSTPIAPGTYYAELKVRPLDPADPRCANDATILLSTALQIR